MRARAPSMGKYAVVGLDTARRTLQDVRLGAHGGSQLRHFPFTHPVAHWCNLLSDEDVQWLMECPDHSDDRLVTTRPCSCCRCAQHMQRLPPRVHQSARLQPFWDGRYKLQTAEETHEFELSIQPCNATGNNVLAWSSARDVVEASMVLHYAIRVRSVRARPFATASLHSMLGANPTACLSVTRCRQRWTHAIRKSH